MTGSNRVEARASLCLYGDLLDPNDVTLALRLTPDSVARKGDKVDPRYAPAKTGRWIYRGRFAPTTGEDVDGMVMSLLDELPVGSMPASIRGVERGVLWIYWSSPFGHGGPYLSPRVLGRLAGLGLALHVDCYCDADEPKKAEAP